MKIVLSNNPIDRFICKLENKIERIKDRRWQNGHHRCICHICGDILDSKKFPYCPETCGWMRLKNKIYNPWICHCCLEHHNEDWIRKEISDDIKNNILR